MAPAARNAAASVALVLLAIGLLWGVAGVPRFGRYRGPYGDIIAAVGVAQRQVTNVATAINFDYRGFDTLGEEFILFTSVAGLALLLREQKGEKEAEPQESREDRDVPPQSDAVSWIGLILTGLMNMFGLYIVLHAHLSPGGGFQGGAMLGTACLLVYLATDYGAFRKVAPKTLMEIAEAAGAGGYALIGIGCMIAGGLYLQNVLPLGKAGDLLSGGTIEPINIAVGLEVAGGFVLLFIEFLKGQAGTDATDVPGAGRPRVRHGEPAPPGANGGSRREQTGEGS